MGFIRVNQVWRLSDGDNFVDEEPTKRWSDPRPIIINVAHIIDVCPSTWGAALITTLATIQVKGDDDPYIITTAKFETIASALADEKGKE
jgi:hypothetical protein